jgi:hypothetical protein
VSAEHDRNRAELLRRLPADMRIEAANRHVEALKTMPIPEVKKALLQRGTYGTMFWSFLEGWDAAMAIRSEEMLNESTELHARIVEYEIEKMRAATPNPPTQ